VFFLSLALSIPAALFVARSQRLAAFRASGAGRIWVSGLEVWGLGFRVSGSGFWVSGFEFQVSGSRFLVSGFWFRVLGFGFRVSGSGFRFFGILVPGLSRVPEAGTRLEHQTGVPRP